MWENSDGSLRPVTRKIVWRAWWVSPAMLFFSLSFLVGIVMLTVYFTTGFGSWGSALGFIIVGPLLSRHYFCQTRQQVVDVLKELTEPTKVIEEPHGKH